MKVNIAGHYMLGLDNKFKHYAKKKLQSKVNKYLREDSNTRVILLKDNDLFKTSIVINEKNGEEFFKEFIGTAQDCDVNKAFDAALIEISDEITKRNKK